MENIEIRLIEVVIFISSAICLTRIIVTDFRELMKVINTPPSKRTKHAPVVLH